MKTDKIETPPEVLAKRRAYLEKNREKLNAYKREHYHKKVAEKKAKMTKRKRRISWTLYDGRLYAKFETKQAKIKRKIQNEYDSLWDNFCSLESLISNEAFRTVERINQIEYIAV